MMNTKQSPSPCNIYQLQLGKMSIRQLCHPGKNPRVPEWNLLWTNMDPIVTQVIRRQARHFGQHILSRIKLIQSRLNHPSFEGRDLRYGRNRVRLRRRTCSRGLNIQDLDTIRGDGNLGMPLVIDISQVNPLQVNQLFT